VPPAVEWPTAQPTNAAGKSNAKKSNHIRISPAVTIPLRRRRGATAEGYATRAAGAGSPTIFRAPAGCRVTSPASASAPHDLASRSTRIALVRVGEAPWPRQEFRVDLPGGPHGLVRGNPPEHGRLRSPSLTKRMVMPH
jgi:hypothetical protein